MKKVITLIAILVIANSFFSLLPRFMPRLPKAAFLPYQLWFNVLAFFFLALPNTTGNFSMFYKK
jgi:hypothetical protein